MSEDEKTNILLGEYEATAANLIKGVNVCPETMNRYHGITGQLLAHVIRSLWTQQDLQAQIETLISAKCAKCERTMSVNVAQGKASGGPYVLISLVSGIVSAIRPIAWPLAFACFSPHIVGITQMVIAAFAKQ